MNTKQKIDMYLKEIQGQENFKITYNNLYTLGKKIEQEVPDIIDKRKQGSYKEFKYVSWKWYEYILRKLDKDFWWELEAFSENYKMVKCKITYLGKEYSAWYAVEDSAVSRETKQPLNNLGEMVVNEGMRCFAKLCSRATGLFMHLWIEGTND